MDQISTTTGKPQAVAVTLGTLTSNVATRTLLRAFIKHVPKCRCLFLSMAPKPILMTCNWGCDWAVLEVLITERRPTKWEWRVCDRDGGTIMGGFESTRPAAKYRGNRALFHLLSTGCAR